MKMKIQALYLTGTALLIGAAAVGDSVTFDTVGSWTGAAILAVLLAAGGMDHDSEPGPDAQRVAAALSVALHGVAMLHRTDTPHLWMSDFSTCEIIQTMVDAAILQLEQAAAPPRP